jgi:hypothetical protein
MVSPLLLQQPCTHMFFAVVLVFHIHGHCTACLTSEGLPDPRLVATKVPYMRVTQALADMVRLGSSPPVAA